MKEQKTTWITFKDGDGCIKSAPLEVVNKVAKKKDWKNSINYDNVDIKFNDFYKSEIVFSIHKENENCFIVKGKTKDKTMKNYFNFNYKISKSDIQAFVYEIESAIYNKIPNKKIADIDNKVKTNEVCYEITLIGRNSDNILLGGVVLSYIDTDYFGGNDYFMFIQYFDKSVSSNTYIKKDEANVLLNYVKSFI